ncbi:hypothetical protein [Cryptosporangium aurantiacum]|uniref:DNA-directed RNA polymerase specialized sigma subunit, sigma24 family n=1 Tax=Cryptosporangium aurantiacum TaxID=134849 RepID=A0A1M7QUE2_9ACTN|nr:hypothetical protein [Cryptosporangium aurantiacum]SHN35409.1 hypothetical protein SAMN05443668_105392 [Cryptosporangium aurantiacum]
MSTISDALPFGLRDDAAVLAALRGSDHTEADVVPGTRASWASGFRRHSASADADGFSQAGLHALFDRYHRWLFGMFMRTLRDRENATIALGQALGSVASARLTRPEQLRPAMARAAYESCIRVGEGRGRVTRIRRTPDATTQLLVGIMDAGGDGELRRLVWRAMETLTYRERLLFELEWHDRLDARELVTVIGGRNAQAVLGRARERIRATLTTAVAVWFGSERCTDLRRLVRHAGAAEGRPNSLRGVIDRHLYGTRTEAPCPTCRDSLDSYALEVLGAALPVFGVPPFLREQAVEIAVEYRHGLRAPLEEGAFALGGGAAAGGLSSGFGGVGALGGGAAAGSGAIGGGAAAGSGAIGGGAAAAAGGGGMGGAVAASSGGLGAALTGGPGANAAAGGAPGMGGKAGGSPGMSGSVGHGPGVGGNASGGSPGMSGNAGGSPGMSGNAGHGPGVGGNASGGSPGMSGNAGGSPGMSGSAGHGPGVGGNAAGGSPGMAGSAAGGPGAGGSVGSPGMAGAVPSGPGAGGSAVDGVTVSHAELPTAITRHVPNDAITRARGARNDAASAPYGGRQGNVYSGSPWGAPEELPPSSAYLAASPAPTFPTPPRRKRVAAGAAAAVAAVVFSVGAVILSQNQGTNSPADVLAAASPSPREASTPDGPAPMPHAPDTGNGDDDDESDSYQIDTNTGGGAPIPIPDPSSSSPTPKPPTRTPPTTRPTTPTKPPTPSPTPTKPSPTPTPSDDEPSPTPSDDPPSPTPSNPPPSSPTAPRTPTASTVEVVPA